MTSTMAGIISATWKLWIFAMRKPVARRKKPPQALKSAIISGVGKRKDELRRSEDREKDHTLRDRNSCDYHSQVPPKIIAVKKSRMDLEMRIVWSPLIPESREP